MKLLCDDKKEDDTALFFIQDIPNCGFTLITGESV